MLDKCLFVRKLAQAEDDSTLSLREALKTLLPARHIDVYTRPHSDVPSGYAQVSFGSTWEKVCSMQQQVSARLRESCYSCLCILCCMFLHPQPSGKVIKATKQGQGASDAWTA